MKKILAGFGIGLATLVLMGGAVYGAVYVSTPESIRNPTFEHYHFRTQISVNGSPVNFTSEAFQSATPQACSSVPPETPIHYHDGVDQLTHIHWNGITGGQYLKYFGWNMIGGSDDSMGYVYSDGPLAMKQLPIHGNSLPTVPEGSNYYVYAGDESSYEQKDWNNFISQNLEDFFGKQSKLKQNQETSFLERLFFPSAYAHGGVDDGEHHNLDDAKLQEINNLIGNVVIFVQPGEPSEAEIVEKFNNLVPLENSICGG
jgi:hypothetical protein